jgi:type II secretory pathway component GspD/PulD (secretin)
MKKFNLKNLSVILCACLSLALPAHAQQRTGGFGGGGFGGGFGGFGGGNNNTANRSASTSQQYTPNGQVGNATISVDDSGNLVIIGDDATIAEIKKVVANLDRPQPQVLIKVVFLEVQHNNASDIGVEGAFGKNIGNSMTGAVANVFGANGLNAVTTNFYPVGPAQAVPGLTPISGSGAGIYQLLGSDFQATLRAIAQAGKAQLLSRPSILARDRQPATIQVGQNVPLITSVNYNNFGTQQNGISYTPIGIILRVTPYITGDGMVQMIIAPETSALNQNVSVPIAAGVNAPAIDIRKADTVAITPDGQTVVIGGLMASDKGSTESKVPFLGDIPLIGNLFKRKTNSSAKTELLIFLTPRIIQAPSQLAALSAREQSNNQLIQKSVSEAELDRFLERVPVKKEKK